MKERNYESIFENLFNEQNDAKPVLEFYYKGKLIMTREVLYDEITLGRNSSSIRVDIDLTEFDIENSFSRNMLKILYEDGEYYAISMAKNPIFLNMNRMEIGKKYLLKGNDKIIITNSFGIKFSKY